MEENKNKAQEQINESNVAKRLEGLGVSMDENIHLESDKEVKGDFWGNVWYRNKWAIIIGAIALVMIIILCFSLCGKDTPDLNIMYVGPNYMVDKADAIEVRLKELYPDYDGEIGFPTLIYQTPEERERLAKEDPDRLMPLKENQNALAQFQMQAMGGEMVLYLIDPGLYENLEGACLDISELLGYELDAELMYDEYAINFKKTDFAKYFEEFEAIPDNAIMCVVKTQFTDEDNLKESCELFKKIVSFEASSAK